LLVPPMPDAAPVTTLVPAPQRASFHMPLGWIQVWAAVGAEARWG